jgi:hypothetical protein
MVIQELQAVDGQMDPDIIEVVHPLGLRQFFESVS